MRRKSKFPQNQDRGGYNSAQYKRCPRMRGQHLGHRGHRLSVPRARDVRAPKHIQDNWGTDFCAPIDLFESRNQFLCPNGPIKIVGTEFRTPYVPCQTRARNSLPHMKFLIRGHGYPCLIRTMQNAGTEFRAPFVPCKTRARQSVPHMHNA